LHAAVAVIVIAGGRGGGALWRLFALLDKIKHDQHNADEKQHTADNAADNDAKVRIAHSAVSGDTGGVRIRHNVATGPIAIWRTIIVTGRTSTIRVHGTTVDATTTAAAVVDLLIARGADLSVCNFNQFTPLALSVQHKTDRVAVALIRAGAPVDDEDSQVLVQLSAMSVAVVQLLVERSIDFSALRSDVSPLHAAAQRGENDNPALVRALIAAGVNRNARDRNGATPLHYCASSGYEDSLRALIQAGAGADVDVVDHDGLTPLHYACGSIKHNCAFVLLAAGADVCARDCNGQTAGHFASELVGVTLSPDTLHLLVAAGTDLDEVDLQGVSVRQMSTLDVPLSPTADERLAMLEKIARERFALVRARAFEICVAIQPLALNALQTVEILVHSCGPAAQLVPFHKWWALATTVKHFQD
jgi:ankyrin repeat protein